MRPLLRPRADWRSRLLLRASQLGAFVIAWSALGLVALGSVRPELATEPAARLRFEYVRKPGAADCPDEAAVRAGVVARLAQDPFAVDGDHILHCEISGDRSGRQARVELRDAAGRVIGVRTLSSKRGDCSELGPALLVVIASASASERPSRSGSNDTETRPARRERPVRAPESPRPAAAAPVAPEPPPEPPPAGPGDPKLRQPVAPEAATGKSRPSSSRDTAPALPAPGAPPVVSFSAGATFGSGLGPRWTWGGLVGAGVSRGWASLGLEVSGTLPSSMAVGGGRISAWATGATLVPCLRQGPLAGCALAGAGLRFGRGEDLPAARSGRAPWAAAGVRAGWRLRLRGGAALDFHADVVLLPVRTVVYAAGMAAWTTPAWAAQGGVTIVIERARRSPELQTDGAHNGQ